MLPSSDAGGECFTHRLQHSFRSLKQSIRVHLFITGIHGTFLSGVTAQVEPAKGSPNSPLYVRIGDLCGCVHTFFIRPHALILFAQLPHFLTVRKQSPCSTFLFGDRSHPRHRVQLLASRESAYYA
jgi:hypothetical protein